MGTAFLRSGREKTGKQPEKKENKNIQIVSYPEFWRKLPRDHPNIWKSIRGRITCLISYRQANDPACMPLLKKEQKDYIYHAELRRRASENRREKGETLPGKYLRYQK